MPVVEQDLSGLFVGFGACFQAGLIQFACLFVGLVPVSRQDLFGLFIGFGACVDRTCRYVHLIV